MHFTGALSAALVIVLVVLYLGGVLVMLWSSRRRPRDGHVLVVTAFNRPRVVRGTTFVFPFLHSTAELDLRDKQIPVDLKDPPLQWADGTSTSCAATVTISIPPDDESILELVSGLGCARGSDEALLRALYGGAVERALREAAAEMAAEGALDRGTLLEAVRARLAGPLRPFEVRNVEISASPG